MRNLILKKDYKSKLNLLDTEIAIKLVKDTFEKKLAQALNLTRVSAPLFVLPQTGLNDDLNGYERAVKFDVLDLHQDVEIVQSLAKWKRNALSKYGFTHGNGLYTDMNAIRRDEELDTFHSIYVDQWDWELIIDNSDRNIDYLKTIIRKIYKVMTDTEEIVNAKYPQLDKKLPEDIHFISSQELFDMYPDMNDKQRETAICKEYGAVFIYQIGWPLSNGKPHDGRACDYDDWTLNGDILVWYDVLGVGLELSSMGIRVNKESLVLQAKHKGEEHKLETPYAKSVLEDKLPLTIGGGIGQSRLCMFFLEKAHIGEVQASVWAQDDIDELEKLNIHLL